MENSDRSPNRSHPAAEDLKCSCGGEEGAAQETLRRGGAGEPRGAVAEGRPDPGFRPPAPAQRRPARPASSRSAAPGSARTCHGCIPERPSVEDQGQLAEAARRGWAEHQQQQRQEKTRLPRHSCAPRPPPEVTAAADPRPVNPELAVPAPRPSPRPAQSLGARPRSSILARRGFCGPLKSSGRHGVVYFSFCKLFNQKLVRNCSALAYAILGTFKFDFVSRSWSICEIYSVLRAVP